MPIVGLYRPQTSVDYSHARWMCGLCVISQDLPRHRQCGGHWHRGLQHSIPPINIYIYWWWQVKAPNPEVGGSFWIWKSDRRSQSHHAVEAGGTTGYKGVGWKSVFRVCEAPHAQRLSSLPRMEKYWGPKPWQQIAVAESWGALQKLALQILIKWVGYVSWPWLVNTCLSCMSQCPKLGNGKNPQLRRSSIARGTILIEWLLPFLVHRGAPR